MSRARATAAILVGAGPGGARIHLPTRSGQPINATVGIITTLWAWNDFLLPLVILSERTDFTLPLTQFVFQSQFTVNYNLAFASYLMAMAPLLIVYVFAQRWIIGGVTSGAVK